MTTTLTATPGATEVRLVASTDNANGHEIRVWRTTSLGSAQIRAWPLLDNGAWAHDDIDIVWNNQMTYRADIYDSAGALLESSSEVGPVQVVNNRQILRDALLPTVKIDIRLVGMESGATSSGVRRTLLRPLGAAAPVVITDARSLDEGTASILTLSQSETLAVRRLLSTGSVLVFSGPVDENYAWPLYVSVGSVAVEPIAYNVEQARRITLEWTQVAPPPVQEPIPAQTWQDLLDANETWLSLQGDTWLDVLYPPVPDAMLFGV